MRPCRRYRCRDCGIVLPAWYAVPGEPNGALLLHHMSQSHPAALRPYLAQMAGGDDITAVILQAFEEVEESATPTRASGLHGQDSTARRSTGPNGMWRGVSRSAKKSHWEVRLEEEARA